MTAFLFPGQGSQSVGMLAELAESYPIVQKTFSQASEALGYDLWNLVQNGPSEDLNSTDKTQPAMLTAGVAVWSVWKEKQVGVVSERMPKLMAGHSLGEYTALVCSGAMDFSDTIKLVRDRGLYMQASVAQGEGAMAAILGMEDDAVIKVCEDSAGEDVLEAVNFNSPGQVVIAGNANAVNRAIEVAVASGAKKAILLPVSVPSHCALMKPAAEKLKARLADIKIEMPEIPVINNVDASIAESTDQIKDALVRQLYQPVRWVDCIHKMMAMDVTSFVECGPGKVLAGLNKRISRRTPALPIFDIASLEKALG